MAESSGMRSLRAHAAAGLVLLGWALVVYAPLLAPGRAPYSPYSDVLAEHLALKRVAFDAWSKSRQIPLWRDDQFSGSPALTNPQALYLHPLHAAFWALPPEAALGITFVLQFWIAGWGCYALARVLGARWLSSVWSGVAGTSAFKLVLAAQAGWLAPLATLALVPWLIAGILRCGQRPETKRALQLAWIAALALAGGSPQPVYYACILTLPCVAFAAPTDGVAAARHRVRALLLIGAALGCGVMANAYLWLPIASESSWISRAHVENNYEYFLSGHGLGLTQLASLVWPAFGTTGVERWEGTAYFGIAPLAFAIIGAVTAPARSPQRQVAIACAVSLLLSFDSPFLLGAYAALPGYATFRLPGRMLFMTTFLGVALAATGVDRVLRLLPEPGAVANNVRRYAPHAFVIALVLAAGIEGAAHVRANLSTIPQAELSPDPDHPLRSPALHRVPRARTAILGRRTLNYGWSAALGLHLVNGYDPYNFYHSAYYFALLAAGEAGHAPGNWFDVAKLARPDLLDELAVRYLVAPVPMREGTLDLVAQGHDVRNFSLYRGMVRAPVYVYENRRARPYARFAREVRSVNSEDDAAQLMATTPATGQAYVIERAAADAGARVAGADPHARVEVWGSRPGHIRLRTDSAARQLLVIAETYHPGWRLRIDDRPAGVLQVNLALLGAWMEPGRHQIELEFVPLRFELGVAITVLALALLLGACAWQLAFTARLRRNSAR